MPPKLIETLQSCGRIPTPPGVVLQLLELTRRPDVSIREIADVIGMDAGLSMKVLRFANSPLAGAARRVNSLHHAASLMGVNGIKLTALSFSILSAAEPKGCKGFNTKAFSLQSLACGIGAQVVASRTKAYPPHEAFVGGLLSQIGRHVLAVAYPEEYSRVLASAKRVPGDLPELEQAAFGETYATIGAQLLASWNLPEPICSAVGAFRSTETGLEKPGLAKILYAAERAASLVAPWDERDPEPADEFLTAVRGWFKCDDQCCQDVMSEIAEATEKMRQVLNLPEAHLRSAAEIEADIRDRIAELSVAMHIENQDLVHNQKALLRRATTDPLTGVGNRAALEARMELELESAARSGHGVAVIMIDVDRFKSFNDTHGHQAGDRVLQAVARTLDDNIRKVDCLARYGGEEFIVVAPNTCEEGALTLAERLRSAVELLRVGWDGKALKVSISLGVSVAAQVSGSGDASELIRIADEQLYSAKCGGRNRVECRVRERAAEGSPSAASTGGAVSGKRARE